MPVGEARLPHIELARETARRFNQTFGETFPEPEALLSNAPRLPGTDNRTMHTSYGNAIFLRDTPEETRRKVRSMYTDPTRLRATDPGHVQGNPVFDLLDVFAADKNELKELKTRYEQGKVGDVEVKKLLADSINDTLAPLRARRAEYYAHPKMLMDLLYGGSAKAKLMAQETLEAVYEKMGLWHDQSLSEKAFAHPTGIFC